mmetsp:Transcript_1236/g.3600  ORF Transcript_1236/g.3600 Transcript_1236/m.3600 type:complete len:221 (-) Transcript_1236:513-1175(-)
MTVSASTPAARTQVASQVSVRAGPAQLTITSTTEPSPRGFAHTWAHCGTSSSSALPATPRPRALRHCATCLALIGGQPSCTTMACLPSVSWLTAITSLLVYVSRSKALSPSMLEPISSGAAMAAQSENCVRACSGELCTAALELEPTSMSGSFQPPGPAYCESLALICADPYTLAQPLTSPEMRHELPSEAPTGAYQSAQPQREKAIGRPVAFSASRMRP